MPRDGRVNYRRVVGSGSPHHSFPLHTPIRAWLSQSARYKVVQTCSQPWGGAGHPGTHRQAECRDGARCPHQDRVGPALQALPQDKSKASEGPWFTIPWLPILAMKIKEENHQDPQLNYFISQMRETKAKRWEGLAWSHNKNPDS